MALAHKFSECFFFFIRLSLYVKHLSVYCPKMPQKQVVLSGIFVTTSLWCFSLLLISFDIPYVKADLVSPVICSLSLLQYDLMCISNNKGEHGERKGGWHWGKGGGHGKDRGLVFDWYLKSPALSLLSILIAGENQPIFSIITERW